MYNLSNTFLSPKVSKLDNYSLVMNDQDLYLYIGNLKQHENMYVIGYIFVLYSIQFHIDVKSPIYKMICLIITQVKLSNYLFNKIAVNTTELCLCFHVLTTI